MIIHFQILDNTLCGAEYKEPSEEQAKNGKLCHDCIQVMWKEEYRRNTLIPLIKKHGVNVKETDELAEKLKNKKEIVVGQPKLTPPRRIKSLRQYLKVKA